MHGYIETITHHDLNTWCDVIDTWRSKDGFERKGGLTSPDGPKERYHFDRCLGSRWSPYSTTQDAWYFGIWLNPTDRQKLEFLEGEVFLTTFDTPEAWEADLKKMHSFYGDPPPAFVVLVNGDRYEVYDGDASHGR